MIWGGGVWALRRTLKALTQPLPQGEEKSPRPPNPNTVQLRVSWIMATAFLRQNR